MDSRAKSLISLVFGIWDFFELGFWVLEFWILVFTTYSKDHRVFHNRLHPEIIYSSLDFSEYEKTLSGSTLKNAKLAEAEAETEKIRRTLVHLGSGSRPRNDFERRVEKADQKRGRC